MRNIFRIPVWVVNKSLYISRSLSQAMLVFLALIGGLIPISAQTLQDLRSQIDHIIRYDIEIPLDHVAGFLIGIIDADSTYVLGYGTRDRESTDEISSQDIFELGSATKVLTAQLVLSLAENQLIDLDTEINNYLPPEFRNTDVRASIRDVLTHRSGLPKIPETLGSKQQSLDAPYADFTRLDVLNWYRDYHGKPPGNFRYSNAAYALMEEVIEYVTGSSYSNVLHQYYAEQFGMDMTDAGRSATLAPGYDLAQRRVHGWTFGSFVSSEGGTSTLNDLMLFLSSLMNDERQEFETIRNTLLPTGDKKLDVGIGWYIFHPKKDINVFVHTGRTSGHSVILASVPQTRTGVVILANSSAGTDDLGLLILRMINRQWRRKN